MSNITFKPQPKVVVKIGRRGDAGTPVELGTSGDLLRWRYVGASSWTNLYDFQDLELPIASIDGLQTALDGKLPTSYVPAWADVSGKPSTFAPSAHNHAIVDVTGLQTALDGKLPTSYVPAWADVSGKPSTFAPATHSHAIADTTGLQTALDDMVLLAGSYSNPSWITALAPSKITQDANYRFVTDTEKTTWNAKQAALTLLTQNSTTLETSGILRAMSGTYTTVGTGKGVEISYDSGSDYGQLLSYDRAGSAFKPFYFNASQIRFQISSATKGLVNSDGIIIGGTATNSGDVLTISNSGASQVEIGQFTSTSARTFFFNRATGLYITNQTNALDHRFFIGGSEKLRLNTNGRLLLNTTTDAGYDFDVNGTGRFASTLRASKLGIGVDPTYGIDIQSSDPSTAYIKVNKTGGASGFLQGYDDGVYFGAIETYPVYFRTAGATRMTLSSVGLFGIGVTPTAVLHLKAGTATANTAPIKLTAGTNLTTPENGAFEFDGTNLYFTVGGVRKTVTLV